MKQSLESLEVSGLTLAVNCAGVVMKATSIALAGLERTNDSGWMVIKVIGDVASIWAVISIGVSFVGQRDRLVAHKAISRPGDGILPHSVALGPESTPKPIPAAPHEKIFVVHDVLEAP